MTVITKRNAPVWDETIKNLSTVVLYNRSLWSCPLRVSQRLLLVAHRRRFFVLSIFI